MALTISQIQSHLERRKFPCVLGEDDYAAIIDAALLEFDRHTPLVVFAAFLTREHQEDYFIFDAADPVTQIPDPDNTGQFLALCADALNVREVYWNPGGDWSSLNIFSPGWQMLSQVILFTGSYFHQPSQMMTLRQKLDSWKTQFGSQGFEVFGEPGDPTAFLRIYPEPQQSDGNVVVEFSRGHTLATIGRAYERYFYQWIEYLVCEAIANYYSQTAGVQLLGFSDSKAAMQYWERQRDRKYEKVLAIQAGIHGQVERS